MLKHWIKCHLQSVTFQSRRLEIDFFKSVTALNGTWVFFFFEKFTIALVLFHVHDFSQKQKCFYHFLVRVVFQLLFRSDSNYNHFQVIPKVKTSKHTFTIKRSYKITPQSIRIRRTGEMRREQKFNAYTVEVLNCTWMKFYS